MGPPGPNGAGKTTTINMILGVLEPSSGTIRVEGEDIATHRTRSLERTNFAAVYAPLPGNLTVAQNLRIFGLLYEVSDLSARIEELFEQFDLAAFRNVKCGLLSSGEQTRVSLAKAMLNRPHLPSWTNRRPPSTPPRARDVRAMHLRDNVRRSSSGGVLWTSHNMYEVAEVCDRVLFLSRGKILLEGNP